MIVSILVILLTIISILLYIRGLKNGGRYNLQLFVISITLFTLVTTLTYDNTVVNNDKPMIASLKEQRVSTREMLNFELSKEKPNDDMLDKLYFQLKDIDKDIDNYNEKVRRVDIVKSLP